jgi:hypothetical protein
LEIERNRLGSPFFTVQQKPKPGRLSVRDILDAPIKINW